MERMIPQHAENVLRVIRDRGVLAAEADCTLVTTGTVNTVVRARHADGVVFVRIGLPRGAVPMPSWLRPDALANEAVVLDRVRHLLPSVPTPIAAGFSPERPVWLIQREVPGRPLADVMEQMPGEAQSACWRAIGRMLMQIHETPAPWFGSPDGTPVHADWFAMVRHDAEGLLRDAMHFGLDSSPYRSLLQQIEIHREALAEVTSPAIVHSDLDARHVFVEPSGLGWKVTGIIDWEYARYVDPWSESLLVDLLNRPADDAVRWAVFEGYGVDPVTISAPAFWVRQRIYRGIARGWAETDAARLGVQ